MNASQASAQFNQNLIGYEEGYSFYGDEDVHTLLEQSGVYNFKADMSPSYINANRALPESGFSLCSSNPELSTGQSRSSIDFLKSSSRESTEFDLRGWNMPSFGRPSSTYISEPSYRENSSRLHASLKDPSLFEYAPFVDDNATIEDAVFDMLPFIPNASKYVDKIGNMDCHILPNQPEMTSSLSFILSNTLSFPKTAQSDKSFSHKSCNSLGCPSSVCTLDPALGMNERSHTYPLPLRQDSELMSAPDQFSQSSDGSNQSLLASSKPLSLHSSLDSDFKNGLITPDPSPTTATTTFNNQISVPIAPLPRNCRKRTVDLIDADLNDITVEQCKKLLRQYGQNAIGKKELLLDRLKELKLVSLRSLSGE